MSDSVRREMLVVTGMSGAGRSTVGNALEDLGWYVVDNLPPQMLRPMVELSEHSGDAIPKVAAIVDVRGGKLFADVQEALESLRHNGSVRVLFLDATDAALVRRFEQVRRPHPLQGDGTLLDGITEERARMGELRSQSDLVLDTSDLNIHQLATAIGEQFSDDAGNATRVTVLSFGFKYGLPSDADLVADARFLPNPFWIPELRPQTGLDEEVREFVLEQKGALEFIDAYAAALAPVLDGYRRENKRHATIAVGCTGGKHRSVAVVEELARRLRELPGVTVNVRHRDLGRE
ncbi:RNase adapter RapZ [Lysinimonas soli]|uniref:RNase adapter RapZ n=1 Tax=Lysinimonas soli TaxID=1074233 RepID=A0ABW0NM36_9MICO